MNHYSNVGATMIMKADLFAFAAHTGASQVRKYTADPYIIHPRAVARLVQGVPGHDYRQVVLALLHDTVEDTGISLDDIESLFGEAMREDVEALTNCGKEMGNRKTRFEINLKRIAAAPNSVKTVKVADLIDNTSTIVQHDPNFAVVYLKEKKELLERALRGADEVLWQRAWSQCCTSMIELEAGA
ncbi:HD domain-containing protein [Shinella zoogloeoides]|uniref:HD domain-containing protein n=1 Tax=Shinella zoogloeoides TaxID=352475 RepID=UPI00273E3042|nr:HD domain-containing protein [Shinella zoogloeoides]WLR90942.1 HD domain-containing protein [Shinella zoogloeoides]